MGFFSGGGKAARRAMAEAYRVGVAETNKGYDRGRTDFEAGAERGRTFRQAPIYQNRAQILERHLNAEDAYSPEQKARMAASQIENRGVGLRALSDASSRLLGGGDVRSGLGARMYAGGASQLFGETGRTLRDIDIASADRAADLRLRAIDTIEGDRATGFGEELGIGGHLSGMEVDRGNRLAELGHGFHMGRAQNYASQSGFLKSALQSAIPAAASALGGSVGGFLTGGFVNPPGGASTQMNGLAPTRRQYGWGGGV